jgi:hypothetical protein
MTRPYRRKSSENCRDHVKSSGADCQKSRGSREERQVSRASDALTRAYRWARDWFSRATNGHSVGSDAGCPRPRWPSMNGSAHASDETVNDVPCCPPWCEEQDEIPIAHTCGCLTGPEWPEATTGASATRW